MEFRIENLTETKGFKLIFDLTTVKEMHLFELASYENYEYGGIFSDFIAENNINLFRKTYTIINDNLITVSFDFYTFEGLSSITDEKCKFNADNSDVIKTVNFIQEWMDEEKLNKYYNPEY
jgi:hypothetical protein